MTVIAVSIPAEAARPLRFSRAPQPKDDAEVQYLCPVFDARQVRRGELTNLGSLISFEDTSIQKKSQNFTNSNSSRDF